MALTRFFKPMLTAALTALLILTVSAAPQPGRKTESKLAELAQRGRSELDAGRFDSAQRIFSEGVRQSARIPDWNIRFSFYLGLAHQKRAESEDSEEKRTAYFNRAARQYLQVLRLKPDSASTMNNLAQTYQGLGRNDEARKFYRLASRQNDPDKSVYELNYADFLNSIGAWKDAEAIYRGIARQSPQSSEPHNKLVEVYLRSGDENLLPYLWTILREGLAARAEATVLKALREREWSEELTDELFAVLAVSLSDQFYDPDSLPGSPDGRALRELADSSNLAVAKCSDELLEAHRSRSLTPDEFDWWRRRGDSRREPERGVWPRDGFRRLLRSLGSRHQRAGDLKRAERYYRLAATFVEDDLDPTAFRKLIDLYMDHNRLKDVEELAREYESRLLQQKGAAQRESQLEKIFDYHQTLGELYSYLGRYGSRSDVASAIFQLDRAMEIAERIESRPDEAKMIRFKPQLADMLATAYEKTGEVEESRKVRIKAAQRYAAAEDDRAVYQVLQPIALELKNDDKQLYERSIRKIPEESLKKESLRPVRPPD